jgi:hypothetical protein
MNKWKTFYANRKVNIIQLNNVRTRSQRKAENTEDCNKEPSRREDGNKEPLRWEDGNKEPLRREDGNKEPLRQADGNREITQEEIVESDKSKDNQNNLKDNANNGDYAEYDKAYNAERERKRRVHFEHRVIVDPENNPTPRPIHTNTHKKTIKPSNHKTIQASQKNKVREQAAKSNKDNAKSKDKPAEVYDLYKDLKYVETTNNDVQIYKDDQFKNESEINNVSDFTLATFLMEQKVKL